MNPSRRRVARRAVLAAAAATLWASGGRPQVARAAAERWIVTNSYVAEIVVALGGADRIVAVGGGSDHIREIAGVPRLPGFRQTSAEPMLSVAPTRVLVASEWIVPQVLDQLRAAGVRVENLDTESSVEGVERRIRAVGRLMQREAAAEALVATFRKELADVSALVARVPRRPRALFVLAGGGRPTLVGGRGTNVAGLLELAGAENVAAGIEGFKAMSMEAMVEAAPEFILTNRDGTIPADGVPVALKAPGAAATPAGRSGRLITIPGEYLQGMGILTPRGAKVLAAQLHPGLK